MSERALNLRVTGKAAIATDVVAITLASLDGSDLPIWQPGAHVELELIVDGIRLTRQYSLCGLVEDHRTWTVAVLRVSNGRGGSAHIHRSINVGDVIKAIGPRNNFPLIDAERYLFIAGGIGITPILPMVRQAAVARTGWRLIYSGRSAACMAFADELSRLDEKHVVLHESDASGFADLRAAIASVSQTTPIYCCGPEPMLRAVEAHCSQLGREQLHIERFAPSEAAASSADVAFEVEFVRSRVTASVPPGRSILEVAAEYGVDIDSSCQEGVCRTCETRVISGVPDHRDSSLGSREKASGRTMLVCVSRARSSRLVLDA